MFHHTIWGYYVHPCNSFYTCMYSIILCSGLGSTCCCGSTLGCGTTWGCGTRGCSSSPSVWTNSFNEQDGRRYIKHSTPERQHDLPWPLFMLPAPWDTMDGWPAVGFNSMHISSKTVAGDASESTVHNICIVWLLFNPHCGLNQLPYHLNVEWITFFLTLRKHTTCIPKGLAAWCDL